MGGAIGPITSLASGLLGAQGAGASAAGQAAADQFKAEMLQLQAAAGETKAAQVGASMTRDLSFKLGNMDAVAAAKHTYGGPTDLAIRNTTEDIGMYQRQIEVQSIQTQAEIDALGAQYMQSAAGSALAAGSMGEIGSIIKGVGGALGGLGGDGGGGLLGLFGGGTS